MKFRVWTSGGLFDSRETAAVLERGDLDILDMDPFTRAAIGNAMDEAASSLFAEGSVRLRRQGWEYHVEIVGG